MGEAADETLSELAQTGELGTTSNDAPVGERSGLRSVTLGEGQVFDWELVG